ncbi:13650_t:CDS:10 [Entrophospora sp. SA101]|nr:13650_t:CDS:10 [Entrophospora sp. SA101]
MEDDSVATVGEVSQNPTGPAITPPTFEPILLQDYLNKLLPIVLGAEEQDLKTSLWNVSETIEKLRKYANDPQINVIYVIKEKEEKKDEVGVNPYEALHSCIHLAVAPYFDAFISAKGVNAEANATSKKHDDSKMGIPMAKKKIAELELSLLHLQQNVDIPDISLNIHPIVQRACKQEAKRVTVDVIDPQLLSDSSFLNKLQADVNGWIKEIQKVTKLSRDPASGTAIQEINFWLSMETALAGVDEQLKSDQISLTLDILRTAKRFHATVSFIADTGLKEATEKVYKYNQLMKDFPLNELLSATDIIKVKDALMIIFNHFNKKLRLSPYPIKKALALVEAISRDLNEQLLKVLGNRRLMYMGYEDFEKVMSGAEEVFKTWEECIKEFTNVARDVTRKRSDKFIPIKINPAHDKLQERVNFVRGFRKQHEQLHQTILKVMAQPKNTAKILVEGEEEAASHLNDDNNIDALEEVRLAYESVKDIDVLDVSLEGTEIWMHAENAYNERVSRVENQIIASLRDRLGTCKNANEMFRVFSKFNALFVRPKIRGAIQEYQTLLLESVKDDIAKLQVKFTEQYRNSQANHMAQLRDLPSISGAMIWARQIDRQLQTYMKRVEDVLGKGWELQKDGEQLQKKSNNFKKKLDTRPIFEAWQADISNRRDLNISGRLFEITKNRAQGQLQLGVNFDPQIITLFKEVRNLLWLDHQVPHNISSLAKVAKRVYPFAVSLMETVRTYAQTVQKAKEHPEIIMLVASYRNDVQAQITKGINHEWLYFVETYDRHFHPNIGSMDSHENQHVTFVREFAKQVSIFQDKVDALITTYEDISRYIDELKTCPYKKNKFQGNLDKIQKLVDRLNLESYSNLKSWVSELDQRIETVLAQRLENAITAWTNEFMIAGDDSPNARESTGREVVSISGKIVKKAKRRATKSDSIDGEKTLPTKLIEKPDLEISVHEVRIRNQVIYLDPPVEEARANWYNQLHEWLAIVCNLPRIQSSRYEIYLQVNGSAPNETSYSDLLTQIPEAALKKAYDVVEEKLKEMNEYVNIWFQFQSLWDLEDNQVYSYLGDDLEKWQKILTEIQNSRSTFDNPETSCSFGPIVVKYEQAQNRVNEKYERWQRDVLNKFSTKLGEFMRDFNASISHARSDLENQRMESNGTGEAVNLITFVQDLKRKVTKWDQDVDLFRKGQKTLIRQRYQFPSDWLYVEQIEGEWSAFNEILTRKNSAIQEQIDGLREKVVKEDKIIETKIKEIDVEWNNSKPIQGDIKPDVAINLLRVFTTRVTKLNEEYGMVCRAKEALDMALSPEDKLDNILEELEDLKTVWEALANIWQKINVLREKLWTSISPRKIRQELDHFIAETKDLPSRVRTYAAFDFTQDTLKEYIKVNPILSELKSEALKDRHWKQLFKALRVEKHFLLPEMTVGNVWELDLKKNDQIIKDIVTQASGELALEEFLKQVKETWTSYILELVNYQNKCRLIKGWDDLFTKCGEHLNSLTAMKMSPYYKTFEEEAAGWEDKLNRIHLLFDVWIDVQRQWVYLEGIFSGSADIKHLLPVESQRFQNIDTEFLTVMKKVYKSPYIVDVLNIQNVQKSLERLADLLSKIQKALGEYLERERSSFPRFYFVGDEDLLEIIGNSKDVLRIQKHFKKMFAGISNILLNEDNTIITGMASRENEKVMFKHPISLKENPKINDWLTLIEKEMRVSLAEWLTEAFSKLGEFYLADQLDTPIFLQWIDKYPTQLVVVASQIIWTQSVEKALTTMEQTDRNDSTPLNNSLQLCLRALDVLADTVLQELPQTQRKKCEHLVTEIVHQRDLIRQLIKNKTSSAKDFEWLYQMRFYFNSSLEDSLSRLTIKMANAQFHYGYEYLGVPDRLVQTPLTDRCYLTLTQALEGRLGGSTGKCWGKGTKFLMYNGTEKAVEEIVVGDKLMGDDSTARNVHSITRGVGQMYKIVPNKKSPAEPFTCNDEHILVLVISEKPNVRHENSANGPCYKIRWYSHDPTTNCIKLNQKTFKYELDNSIDKKIKQNQAFSYCSQVPDLTNGEFKWEVSIKEFLNHKKSIQKACRMYKPSEVHFSTLNGNFKKVLDDVIGFDSTDEQVKSFAWLIGAWIAGGFEKSVSTSAKIVKNDMTNKLEECGKFLGLKLEFYRYNNELYGGAIKIYNKFLNDQSCFEKLLRKLNILNKKNIPTEMIMDDIETVRLPLLGGLLDTSSYYVEGREFLFDKERRHIAESVARIANLSGFCVNNLNLIKDERSPLCELKNNNMTNDNDINLFINGGDMKKIPSIIINNNNQCKLQILDNSSVGDYAWEFMIETLENDSYYGFTVDGNRRMLLRDLTVTHNTESVKALGVQLGRFVLVFCCDENFDFQAMGRIFVGLCQVGAWGCFDEFNRLEERILSAVSQQVQTIQLGLKAIVDNPSAEVEIVGKNLRVNSNTGIFITMNPGYAGRSNLPDNLKKLFRSIAMTKPDRELIAQVMLYSQGFRTAEILASKVVPLFNLCAEQLSPQAHYDFGLRALKSVLVSAGNLKRERLQTLRGLIKSGEKDSSENIKISEPIPEQEILIQSVRETIVPKLVADDIPLLTRYAIDYVPVDLEKLTAEIKNVCEEKRLLDGQMWMEKVLQLYQIQNIHHGLMMVGPSGSGKSLAWKVLLEALGRVEGVEGISYVIDPKAVSKDALYGNLDHTTREWTDGLFTHILRKIIDNVRGEKVKRHWIIFDGDVDPEWVENLNSVLDDNRLLTLPNGERLGLPGNVRIMFEVENLKYATLATVSRCGMVWFSEEIVTLKMIYSNYLETLKNMPMDDNEEDGITTIRRSDSAEENNSPHMGTQRAIAAILSKHLTDDGLVTKALEYAEKLEHIMDFTRMRVLTTLFSLLNKTVRNVIEYNVQHPDFPMTADHMENYVVKRLILGIIWSFSGDAKLELRSKFGDYIRGIATIDLPPLQNGFSIIDYDVQINNGEWVSWTGKVPTIEIETHKVAEADIVIPTIDTVRHEEVLYSWLSEHKPLMLCGPPGSGKTMTLFSALRKLPDMEVVGLNFSSATTPELILKTFEQYCEYRKTLNGVILSPVSIGRWIVVFCDEINLPATDKYGTQRVISFLRQLVECGGYWRTSDKSWVRLERIQFVGACNPPTDPGRVPLTHRFLRHAPLIMVDYPGEISLNQIYGTFSRAMLKVVPALRAYAENLTSSMVEFYLMSQKRFTPDIQAHYIYSPRELTRWMRGIYEAIKPMETLSLEGLIRIWAHEALRLFQDRLVTEDERKWTDENIDAIALKHFPNLNQPDALSRPILFSNWLSRYYTPVEREELRDYVKARLKVFYEEELDVPLVLFNDVLDHVLRIDRVFRQMQGHLLLIGVSGSGKTTLSRFVAWMNGLSVFQIKAHNKYTGEDFDEDLRTVLRRSGCKGEKICFILDESNVLDSGFLERMNTLLANAEVPGLFEGDEFNTLMTGCKEGSQREGLMLDSHEELYKWFTQQVMKNLHVVFTMNPPEGGLASRAATSPALFNRCVLDWFGDWSDQAFFQVGMEFTQSLDLDLTSYSPSSNFPVAYRSLSLPPTHRNAVVNAFVFVHQSLYEINAKLSKRQGKYNYVTPRHFLDFINHYVRLFNEKREDLEEQQRHLNIGLEKLRDTVVKVEELKKSLSIKEKELKIKDIEANEKLNKMVKDQRTAEKNEKESRQIHTAVEIQNKEIEERRAIALRDIENAQPAVEEAKRSVQGIRKTQLTEVRSMANPPEAVKLAMTSVCTLLGFQIDGWKAVQGAIRREDFISSIVNFDTEKNMTKSLRDKMRNEFLSNKSYNYELVNRASKACGPLVKWVEAQVIYSDILDRVAPLRHEVAELEKKQAETKVKLEAINKMIKETVATIAVYKDEYGVIMKECGYIKDEMIQVKDKVDRSLKLLSSLSSEKQRWESGSQTFETQMGTIVGDVLLSAAFLAYGGYFDQQYREILLNKLTNHLISANIQFKQELSLTEYLSTADDRLSWQANSLPADDLCTENAIMLKRFNRYPLIIDPSGQASAFLMNEFKEKKITVTSFLDDSFIKNLESALRFGNPLLIQDVEHLDPILNAVLNKELRRTGGRVLIRLGGQDIDFSPSFTLFLSTRDPSVNFPPDVCSRVTFVNFTVTHSSLQSQCLNQVLKVERPDTDKKRTDLIKLQGEFRLKLRHLEKSLLQALNESKGNILDDGKVLETLETLKKEAAEITHKVEETESIMKEVEQVTTEYTPLAQACSSVFFVMEQMNLLHHFYQFSLEYFYEIFQYVLHENPNLKGVTNSNERLIILMKDLFNATFRRVSRALLHDDYITFAILLAQIKLRGTQEQLDETEYDYLLSGGDVVPGSKVSAKELGFPEGLFDSDILCRIREFSTLPCFSGLTKDIANNKDDWKDFYESDPAEKFIPVCWDTKLPATVIQLRKLLIIKCFRPDRLISAVGEFVSIVFDAGFINQAELDLKAMVLDEVNPTTPISLCSVPGYDASYRVDNLVAEVHVRCKSVAMGSQEGFALADQAITTSIKNGEWVLLKNVHLAPSWLGHLEKKLHSMNAHRNFRLFLTMETNPKVPVNLLRLSRILMFEPPPGIKANLQESLKSIPHSRISKGPTERVRLYFLLSWLHAIVQERLRYVPLGWTKIYEFNDSDQDFAINTIDAWLDSVAQGRTNISPDKIPWDAIRTLISIVAYGGRVDNEFDKRLLDNFVGNLFTPASYDLSFPLVKSSDDSEKLLIPEGSKIDQFMEWVNKLPDNEPPSWLANAMLVKIRKMKSLSDDDEVAYAQEASSQSSGAYSQPAWMRALYTTVDNWLKILPKTLSPMKRTAESIKNPLFRFFDRENQIGCNLLNKIQQDLSDIKLVCEGQLKQTNHLRMLLNYLTKDHWCKYKVPKTTSLNHWVADFKSRLQQLENITKESNYTSLEVWLGGLFMPEAYITATRQAVAQKHRWSLEELKLEVDLNTSGSPNSFAVSGMKLAGAQYKNQQVQLITNPMTKLELSQIRWILKTEATEATENIVSLPVYLNEDRSDLLFVVDANVKPSDKQMIAQRGVAIIVY